METRNNYYIHVTWTRFCALVDSWIAKRPVLCHLFRYFDSRFKENIHCHPAFIIRDINIYRNSYSKGLLKSRESDHYCVNTQSILIHHKASAIFNSDAERSAVNFFEFYRYVMYGNTNSTEECSVVGFERNSYRSDGSSGPWILKCLLSRFLDKC